MAPVRRSGVYIVGDGPPGEGVTPADTRRMREIKSRGAAKPGEEHFFIVQRGDHASGEGENMGRAFSGPRALEATTQQLAKADGEAHRVTDVETGEARFVAYPDGTSVEYYRGSDGHNDKNLGKGVRSIRHSDGRNEYWNPEGTATDKSGRALDNA